MQEHAPRILRSAARLRETLHPENPLGWLTFCIPRKMDLSNTARTVFYCGDDDEDLFLFTEVVNEIDPQHTCITCPDSEEALTMLSTGNL